MEKTIIDERTGWEYELKGEQYYPTGRVAKNGVMTPAEMPEENAPEEESRFLGIWAQQHLNYIRRHKKSLYLDLYVSGRLNAYLAEINAQAEDLFLRTVKEMAALEGVTEKLVIDPNGSSYSHRLPSGEWLLGGAGNIGGRTLNACAEGRDFDALNAASEALIPTGVRCYPLPGRGERFPFVLPDCEPFYIGNLFGGRLYPAIMEGVGYAEKLAFDHMAALGCPVGETIYTTGGACRSDLWLRIRASILERQLKVPAVVDAAMGSALLAASGDMGGLDAAAEAMIHYEKTAEPDPALTGPYRELYARFREDVRKNYGVEV